MTPVEFPEVNTRMGPPKELVESQCHTIGAYIGTIESGSCEGAPVVVVAYHPNEAERAAIANGRPIFLSCLGGLPPHFLCTSFAEATKPL